MGKARKILLTLALTAASSFSHSVSQEFVYRPVNPSFGGNPFNSSHLVGLADAQNDNEPPQSDSAGTSQSDLFVRQLQSRLLSSLSRDVTEAIFGEDAAEFGRVVFGDQTIEFERGLENIRISIFDAATGTTTDIEVPVLQTDQNG
ncbi:MAG: curli assembly protein CsgF [Pseudomonadota bacterium]